MPYPRLLLPLGIALFLVGMIVGARPGLLADLDLRATTRSPARRPGRRSTPAWPS